MFDNRKWFAFLASLLATLALSTHAWAVGPFFEDFEGIPSCTPTCGQACSIGSPNVTNVASDDTAIRDWIVDAGGTTSSSTGPSVDHTLGTTAGQYVYVETSSSCASGGYEVHLDSAPLDIATMMAPSYEFYYHAFGASIGELHVDVLDVNKNVLQADIVPAVVGDQGDMWIKSTTALLTPFIGQGQVIVRIRYVHNGPSFDGDIALDDIEFFDDIPDDVGVSAIPGPVDLACGMASQDVVVEVTNFGANPKSNIPLTVNLTGDITQSYNLTVPGPLNKGDSAQVVAGQINSLNGVEITVTATTGLAGDLNTANDQLVEQKTLPSLLVGFTPPATVCPGDSASIAVDPETDIDYQLYDAPTDGNLLAQGNPIVTPPIEASGTYYIERTNVDEMVGAADDTIGMGAQYPTFQDGLVFNVTAPVSLTSVKVIPGATGNVTVRVLDSTDTQIGGGTAQIDPGDVGMLTEIPIGLQLPVGSDYKLDASGSTVTTLFRNSGGAAYPYTSDSVSIIGAKNGLPDAYYFFYDWVVTQDSPVCADQRTPVMITTDPSACSADLAVTITGPDAADPGTPLEYTITVTNNGPTVAGSVQLNLTTPPDITFVSNTGDCDTAFPCSLGDLAPMATATVASTFSSPADLNASVDFTAVVSSATPDPNTGDESATQTTQIGDPPMGVGGGGPGVGGGGPGVGGGDSTGSGVVLPPPPPAEDEGGCAVSQPGSNDDAPWAFLAAGLGLAVLRRRRRAA